MTDSMNFGPEWLRNLSSEGSTTINASGTRYQLAEYRYGREEMLALFEKGLPAPNSLCTFTPLYSESSLLPLALLPTTEEERQWPSRTTAMGQSPRGRGVAGPGERGGRISRGGRGAYQPYGRNPNYESGGGWGNGEQTEWSPRKDFSYNRSAAPGGGVDNWRRSGRSEDEEGWRGVYPGRFGPSGEKWNRSANWRENDEERGGAAGGGGAVEKRAWHDGQRGPIQRRNWDSGEDHLPEWATENLGEGGGTFDASGAFHGSDDEQDPKGRREHLLQKSASQQNITTKPQHPPLSTSKSALSLSKPPDTSTKHQAKEKEQEREAIVEKERVIKEEVGEESVNESNKENRKRQKEGKLNTKNESMPDNKTNQNKKNMIDNSNERVADEDFDKFQEDLVLKLVVDEEPSSSNPTHVVPLPHSNGIPPPPNMMPPPIHDKWFYQDPQGDLQGPFLSTEMAEWFRAGYFSTTLFVRRHCDERFYTLGELVSLCSGSNPFQSTIHIPPLKQQQQQQENKIPDELLQYPPLLQAQILRSRSFNPTPEAWSALQQQRELMSQQMIMQQQQQQQPPQIPNDSYISQGNATFLHMLNQLQQSKMPSAPTVVEKQGNAVPCQLDPLQTLVQQMGGLQAFPNRMQPPGTLPMAAGSLKHDTAIPSIHGLPVNGMPGNSVPVPPPSNLIGNLQKPPPPLGKLEGDNFMQFFQKPPMEQSVDLETFWRKSRFMQNQEVANSAPSQTQWKATDKPISMWDLPNPSANLPPSQMDRHHTSLKDNLNDQQSNDSNKESLKEEKKRKEFAEKQAKKEADDKRKSEQKRQEAERKQIEEKRRKDDERIRREIEKVKKEAEEKRQKELAEKRKLKEQRRAEEEARKKSDEMRKIQEDQERERIAKEREREEQQKKQQQMDYARHVVSSSIPQKVSRPAPWSQTVNNQGLSLNDIQRLERERRAEQAALMQQQRLQQQQQQQQQQLQEQIEKTSAMHLGWTNKSIKPNNVKSLVEIQAEEQEKLLKLKRATEKTQHKEKETLSPPTSGFWSGQSLTWGNSDSSNINSGFWDDPHSKQSTITKPTPKQEIKPVIVVQQQQQLHQQQLKHQQPAINKNNKLKAKKEETNVNNNTTMNTSTDEFTNWCTKTLTNMNTPVDIPTFVSLLLDIESALDVREICRDYLGDKPATQQFSTQFLEKRRSFKPKVTTHKDDMCSPAPAITPSTQHNYSEFQEVKGKGKKCKKSKMLKVDARILGFNVTAAQDRINVGDRDYGDT